MPQNFINGGYGFSTIAMIGSLFLTLYCAKLLLDTRKALGGNLSFSEIGQKTYGKAGKIMVDVTLIGSQFSFVTAYIYFISQNLQVIIQQASIYGQPEGTPVPEPANRWIFGALCFCIYWPLCMIRRVEKLAVTHLFGDIMILITIVVIFAYSGITIANHGFRPSGMQFI